MFEEYGIYHDDKFIGLICENQFFVKKTKAGEVLLTSSHEASPYFVLVQLEDRTFLSQFIQTTYEEISIPKPKNKK